MKMLGMVLVCALWGAQVQAEQPQWVKAQGAEHWCAGVGQESRQMIEQQAASADVRVVLTAGAERGYVNDVALTLTGPSAQTPVGWTAEGPICLVKLAPGRYRMDARYGQQQQSTTFSVAAKKPSRPPTVQLHFANE